MTDRYSISGAAGNRAVPAPPKARRTPLRTALWLGLFATAATNATLSSIGVNPFISAGFGLVALSCVAGLIANHYRSARR